MSFPVVQQHQVNHHEHHYQAPEPSNPTHARSPSPNQIGSPSSSAATSTENITNWIHAGHYQMLMNGNLDVLREEIPSVLNHLTEFDNSSALHIAAMARQTQLIQHIRAQFDNSNIDGRNLVLGRNSKGDLPIHVAVRAGNIHSAFTLLENSTPLVHEMLETENNHGNTPLHIALENQQKDMAERLFHMCPHTFHRLNRLGMSPLYLAIKAGFWDLVKRMLVTTDVGDHGKVHDQLDRGRVVHAAIMAKNLDILKLLLDNYMDLRYSSDEKLRRPLSYAAFTGFLEGVSYFLGDNNFKNLAFRPDEDGSFPIHRACSGGNIEVVKEFLEHSINMMWLSNLKGQNILHVAAETGKAKVVNYILGLPDSESLINMKDEDGNTPLHLASKGKHPKVVYALTWDVRVKLNLQNNQCLTALDVAEDYGQVPSFEERLTWLALRYAGVPRAPQIQPTTQATNQQPSPTQRPDHGSPNGLSAIPNNSYFTPVAQDDTAVQLMMSPSNKYKERLNTLLMVSTLVATVTFASGFTVPGGYNQNNPNIGMATLAHKLAFQVFVISNTIALFSSTLAMVILIWAHLDDLRLTLLSLDFALPLLGTALAMMSVAFMAGLFVVLHNKVWLGLVVVVIGGGFLGALTVFFIPLYSPTSRIESKLLRYVFHVPFKLMLLACEKGKSETFY